MDKVNFNEIFSASAEKLKELLDNSVIWGGSSDQIFSSGKFAAESLVINRNINILPGTLAPAACKTGVDMGDYVSPNADSATRQNLREELEIREAYNKQLDAQLKSLVNQRCASEIAYRCLKAAQEYQEWTLPEFKREWTQTKSVGDVFSISNAVYTAEICIDHETWRKKPYRVSYVVRMRDVRPTLPTPGIIVEQGEQCYADPSDAMRCVERRQKAYDKKYFSEDVPSIPKEYAQVFTWAGALLPGYRVEEEGEKA